MSDIDTAVVVDGLKALDPKWPIREADIAFTHWNSLPWKNSFAVSSLDFPCSVRREFRRNRLIIRLSMRPELGCGPSL